MPSGVRVEFTLEETPPAICRPGIWGIWGMPLGEMPSNFRVRTTDSPTMTDSRSREAVKRGWAAKRGVPTVAKQAAKIAKCKMQNANCKLRQGEPGETA